MKKDKLFLGLFLLFYFITRIWKLGELPPFNDEILYLDWARLASIDFKNNLFFSLSDGQPPLFIWLLTPIYYLTKNINFLNWGRFLLVIFGALNIYLLYLIGKKIKDSDTGLIASFLYIISPFTLFYDRLIMREIMMFFWGTFIFYLLLRKGKYSNLVTGLSLGLAFLTKSTAYFFIGSIIIYILLKTRKIGALLKEFTIIFGTAFLIKLIMNFSSYSSNIGPKNQIFLLTSKEFFQNPFLLFQDNMYQTVIWLVSYISIPILVLSVIGFVIYFKKDWKKALFLLSFGIIPIILEVFMAKLFFPRYFILALLPIIIFSSLSLRKILAFKNRIIIILTFLLAFYFNLYLDYRIIFDLKNAELPKIEKWQFIEGWPSGYGFLESVEFINNQYSEENIKILTEEIVLSNLGYGLYLKNRDNIEIESLFTSGQEIEYNNDLLNKNGITLVVLLDREAPKDWPLREVFSFKKDGNNNYIRLFEIDLDLYQSVKNRYI